MSARNAFAIVSMIGSYRSIDEESSGKTYFK